MEWELADVLFEVKRLYYRNIHGIERLMLYNSMAQNAALAVLKKQRTGKSAVLTVAQMEAVDRFEQIRQELILLCARKADNTSTAFYQMRRRLIENIEAMTRGSAVTPSKESRTVPVEQAPAKKESSSLKKVLPVVAATNVLSTR